jgi:hypothetical protein
MAGIVPRPNPADSRPGRVARAAALAGTRRAVRQRAKRLVRRELAARVALGRGRRVAAHAVGRGAGVDLGGEDAQHRHESSGRMVGLKRRDLRCEQHVTAAAEGDAPVGVADWPHERYRRRGTRFAPSRRAIAAAGSRPPRAAQRSGSSQACDSVRLGYSPRTRIRTRCCTYTILQSNESLGGHEPWPHPRGGPLLRRRLPVGW